MTSSETRAGWRGCRTAWGLRGLCLGLALTFGPSGCLPDAPGFACGADGVTPRCSTPGSECRAGYCAVRAADCASGWRFTESAAAPGVCVPASDADPGAVDVQAVDDVRSDDRPSVDDVPPEAGIDAPTVDLGVDAGVGVDVVTDLGVRDTGAEVADAGAVVDTGADAQVDVTADLGQPDAGIDGGRPDAGIDAGIDAGPPDAGPPDAGPPDAGPPDAGPPDAGQVPPGPVILLEPITNARVRGDRVRFRARVGVPNYNRPLVVRLFGPDCNTLTMTRLELAAPGFEAALTLPPGIHCYDVLRGVETVVRHRRVLVEGGALQGASAPLFGGFLQDFDRSGMADVLVGRAGGTSFNDVATPILFDANRQPSERLALAPPMGGQLPSALRGWYAGDLDNDGHGDALVLYRVNISGEPWLQLMRYRGSPTGVEVLGDSLASVRESAARGYALAAGPVPDLDDDGIGELVLVHGDPLNVVELRTSRAGFGLVGQTMQVDGVIAHAAVLPPTAVGVSAAVAWAGTRLGRGGAVGVVEYRGTTPNRVDITLSTFEDRAAPAAMAGGFDMLGTSFADFAYVAGTALRVVYFDPTAASGQGAYVAEANWLGDSTFSAGGLVGVAPVTRFMGGRDAVVVLTSAGARAHLPGGRVASSMDTYAAPVTALGTTAFGQQGSLLVARPSSTGSLVHRLFRVDLNDAAMASAAPLGVPAALAPLWLSR